MKDRRPTPGVFDGKEREESDGKQPKGPRKIPVTQVEVFLSKHRALIVHFSGTPKGGGSDFEDLFPADLQKVVDGAAMGGLSCSAIRPSDEFADLENANATGCVGVVLGLQDSNSLVAVDPHDCGSMVQNGLRLVPDERDLDVADLERSFEERTSYNEWVIRNYSVIGIFLAPPGRVSIMQVPEYPPDMPEEMKGPVSSFRCTSVEELRACFPDLPIYQACPESST